MFMLHTPGHIFLYVLVYPGRTVLTGVSYLSDAFQTLSAKVFSGVPEHRLSRQGTLMNLGNTAIVPLCTEQVDKYE
jgi:hypothetical protein